MRVKDSFLPIGVLEGRVCCEPSQWVSVPKPLEALTSSQQPLQAGKTSTLHT